MTDHTESLVLTNDERALIQAMRDREAEVDRLAEQAQVEEREWRAAHPGELYSALSIDGSAGGESYTKSAEACAEAAVEAFALVARRLGITGFQASWAELEFVRRSRGIEGTFGLYQASDLLYPQYDPIRRIENVLTSDEAVRWLGDRAEQLLADSSEFAADTVLAHWRSLVARRDALALLKAQESDRGADRD